MSSSAGSTSANNDKLNYEVKFKDPKEMKRRWEAFTKFGAATATEMTGKNFDKWLKDAGKKANYAETKQIIATVAQDKAKASKRDIQEEIDDICAKLERLEAPVVKNVAKPNTEGGSVYSRLTDHTKYTGAHKERFDAEGKGRGKAGRVDAVENTGYVASYKNKDTYDKSHPNK
ncbi:p25-alpha domain-containing protein [Ditylenchus destructor]|uniref:P25-alpha domain-containing protein n=1 Tax=Ditylenchus destructor TaxID=166010 RepID=A0AAD4NB43_9BILA|nr:p25-alpha domain-containing protein [Ditylenchus destructor]